MVSVLPAPAPAITTSGPGGAAMTAACSSVGAKRPSAEASSVGAVARRHDVVPLGSGLGGAHRPHRAVRAAVVDAGEELRAPGWRPRPAAPARATRPGVSGVSAILLALGGTRRARLAEIDQAAAAGRITLRQKTFRDGQLIHRQLGVALRIVLGDGALAGLDVDDHQPARAVAFEPVEPAAHPHPGAVAVPSTPSTSISVPTSVSSPRVCARHCAKVDSIARCRASSLSAYHSESNGSLSQTLSSSLSIWLSVLPGLGDQGVQQRPDRRPHIAAVGAAVAFEQPAQRAVGQRLQRRRRQRHHVVVTDHSGSSVDSGVMPYHCVGSAPATPAAASRANWAAAQARTAVVDSAVRARRPPRAAGRPARAGASTRGAWTGRAASGVGIGRQSAPARRRTARAASSRRRCRCRPRSPAVGCGRGPWPR